VGQGLGVLGNFGRSKQLRGNELPKEICKRSGGPVVTYSCSSGLSGLLRIGFLSGVLISSRVGLAHTGEPQQESFYSRSNCKKGVTTAGLVLTHWRSGFAYRSAAGTRCQLRRQYFQSASAAFSMVLEDLCSQRPLRLARSRFTAEIAWLDPRWILAVSHPM
jgi:hypothetical protein